MFAQQLAPTGLATVAEAIRSARATVSSVVRTFLQRIFWPRDTAGPGGRKMSVIDSLGAHSPRARASTPESTAEPLKEAVGGVQGPAARWVGSEPLFFEHLCQGDLIF